MPYALSLSESKLAVDTCNLCMCGPEPAGQIAPRHSCAHINHRPRRNRRMHRRQGESEAEVNDGNVRHSRRRRCYHLCQARAALSKVCPRARVLLA